MSKTNADHPAEEGEEVRNQFQFYRCKINSFHCNTGHPDVQDVGSIGVAFMNLTYTCKKYSPSYSLSKHWKSLDQTMRLRIQMMASHVELNAHVVRYYG